MLSSMSAILIFRAVVLSLIFEYKPGEYIEGELSLFLDAGLMRPFEYGLYKKIPEASRNGFFIVKISRIMEVTQNGPKSIEAIDAEMARERQSDYIIECEAGNPSGNFVRDDLTMKTLDFYLERQVAEQVSLSRT